MSIELSVQAQRGALNVDVDMSLPSHGVTAFFGASGAGKTTLLRILAGLERVESATVKFNDTVWQQGDSFVPVHERSVGVVFQEPSLFAHLSVEANIAYAAKRARSGSPIDMAELLELLGISTLLNRAAHTLSGGEQQRVAIARSLAANPVLLLMDEPLAAVDTQRRDEILPYLERLPSYLKLPLIYVSHAMDEVARIADNLVLIEAGSVLAHGPLERLLTQSSLPLALRDDAEAVVNTVAASYDNEYQLNQLEFQGGELKVLGEPIPPRTPVRIRVAARDVSIVLEPQTGSSILNVLPAQITDMKHLGGAQVLISLAVGEQVLLSRITQYSAQALGLAVGKSVFAQVKSVAVLR